MAQEQQQAAEYNFSFKQIFLAMAAVFAVYGTLGYFVQSLNVARPKMAADLNGLDLYSWSVSIPSLFSAFVTLIYGKLSDMYGRRIMLMVCLIFTLIGTILSANSPTFIFLIIASVISALGMGGMMPLVFAVVGDVFPPSKRATWIGLLNIPIGFFSLVGPVLSGYLVDALSWRYIYWGSLPLLIFCLVTVPVGVPSLIQRGVTRKIDYWGCLIVGVASSTTIIGLSFAGTYPWTSVRVAGLLGVALLFWIIFFSVEGKTKEPILDPLVIRNRSFLTVAIATILSSFGQMGMMMYFPMFLQGVQNSSATRSGFIIIPYSLLTAFIGVPVGFLLAWTKRYKWLYILGVGILVIDMFGIIFFTEGTAVKWCFLATAVAGLGMGAIPTVNTVVVQSVVPKRLLGAAMGAIFFCISMGVAISPAVLGSAMNAAYAKKLAASMPSGLKEAPDEAIMAAIENPRALLSWTAKTDLENRFRKMNGGQALFQQTVQAIRSSLEAGVKSVFWVSAITMLLAFLLISTIPEIPLDAEVQDKAPQQAESGVQSTPE